MSADLALELETIDTSHFVSMGVMAMLRQLTKSACV